MWGSNLSRTTLTSKNKRTLWDVLVSAAPRAGTTGPKRPMPWWQQWAPCWGPRGEANGTRWNRQLLQSVLRPDLSHKHCWVRKTNLPCAKKKWPGNNIFEQFLGGKEASLQVSDRPRMGVMLCIKPEYGSESTQIVIWKAGFNSIRFYHAKLREKIPFEWLDLNPTGWRPGAWIIIRECKQVRNRHRYVHTYIYMHKCTCSKSDKTRLTWHFILLHCFPTWKKEAQV